MIMMWEGWWIDKYYNKYCIIIYTIYINIALFIYIHKEQIINNVIFINLFLYQSSNFKNIKYKIRIFIF